MCRLYNQWFDIADADRDGVVSGGEAVQFFMRSGLPQNPTLFKVWQYVAGDRPALNRKEFYTSMKLVSLAQRNQGVLDDQTALRLVNGLAGPVPPPVLQGLPVPNALLSAPPAQQSAMAQPQVSPARPAPPPVGGSSPWPVLAAEQANAFQTAFSQLDTDRDGYVQGSDCFGTFMQSGLSKEALRLIWDVVAGDAGALSAHQFIQAAYIIDCAKKGIPIPTVLPSGPFPPVAGTVNLDSLAKSGEPNIFSSASLQVPELAQRASFIRASMPTASLPQKTEIPVLREADIAALAAAEAAKLEAERDAALKAEQQRQKIEEERLAAQAKREFFTKSLGDLRLTQSNIARATVEAQQRLELEATEAAAVEADYDTAYAEYSVAHAQCAPLLEKLREAQEERSGLTTKLENLKAAIVALEDADPEREGREAAESEALKVQIAQLTVQKETLAMRLEAAEKRREGASAAIASLKEATEVLSKELGEVESSCKSVDASTESKELVAALARAAVVYNKLYDAAKMSLLPLPPEAIATVKKQASPFRYDDLAVVNAGDWGDFKDEGFIITSALPLDNRLVTLTSPSLAAAALEDEHVELEMQDGLTDVVVEEERIDDEGTQNGGPFEVIENEVFESKEGEKAEEAADNNEKNSGLQEKDVPVVGSTALEGEEGEEEEEQSLPTEAIVSEGIVEKKQEGECQAAEDEAATADVQAQGETRSGPSMSAEENGALQKSEEGNPVRGAGFGSTVELSKEAQPAVVGEEEPSDQAGGGDWTAF